MTVIKTPREHATEEMREAEQAFRARIDEIRAKWPTVTIDTGRIQWTVWEIRT